MEELHEWKKRGYAVCGDTGCVHVGLREFDLAMDEYEQGLANGECFPDILDDPTLDELRALPRFQGFLEKLGLEK